MMDRPPSAIPRGAKIHAHEIPRPLRKKNHTPSGGTTIAGRPASIQRHETLRRAGRLSSSSVPRIAATMFTELTWIEEKTTVRNVTTTPRQ